jgi:hypothetical protein
MKTNRNFATTERYGKYQTEKLVSVMRGKKAPFTPEKGAVHSDK